MSVFKTIIQIGSYVGNTRNDPLFDSIDSTTRLFLIEPVPFFFQILKKNYAKTYPDYYSNIVFINKAVSTYDGIIEMHVPSMENDFDKFPSWTPQLASVRSDHISRHIQMNPRNGFEKLKMDTIQVTSATLNSIISEYQISSIHILQIDTEGHDYDILMHYDFEVKPQKLVFEHVHTPFDKYQQLEDKLYDLDYEFDSIDNENVVFILKS